MFSQKDMCMRVRTHVCTRKKLADSSWFYYYFPFVTEQI